MKRLAAPRWAVSNSILSGFLDPASLGNHTCGATAAVAARSAAPQPSAASPRAVTTGGKSGQAAIVDWMRVTFAHDRGPGQLLEELSPLLGGRPVGFEPMTGGLLGFTHGVRLVAYAFGRAVQFASYCWGGEHQRGRAMLEFPGGGCRLVDDWEAMADYVGELPAWKLTRVDLAVDLYEGEYSIDDAHTWALEGRFVNGGRPPQLDCQGDWITREHGRTLNVGRREHGKTLCIYEKGKQLGDLSSPWVRWEARFGCRDRELPLSILTERDSFFAGAYPALQEILGIVGERIKTIRETSRTTIERALEHMARSYGGYLHVLSQSGADSADLVESITVRAVPRRLDIASLADAGFAATVHAVIEERMVFHERHDGRDGPRCHAV